MRGFTVLVFATIVAAWFAGGRRKPADLAPHLPRALPGAQKFTRLDRDIHAGFAREEANDDPLGHVAIGTASGYGGPLSVAVGVDMKGRIRGLSVVEHRETAAFFQRVTRTHVLGSLKGKPYSAALSPGADVDTVSGATRTLTAITRSVRRAANRVAVDILQLPPAPEPPQPFQLGARDIILAALFLLGFLPYVLSKTLGKRIRWITLLTGLLALGFFYDIPLTIVDINALLLGYWPAWQSHLHWYVMLVGVLVAVIVFGKSPYCEEFCPFGAAQELVAVIGGARSRKPRRYHRSLRSLPRLLAWGAILLAIYYRNPDLTSYESFGALFALTGSTLLFGFLGAMLVASLFVVRPWCRFFCPLRGVTDYLRTIRAWVLRRSPPPD